MKKRIFALFLGALLTISYATPVFATELDEQPESVAVEVGKEIIPDGSVEEIQKEEEPEVQTEEPQIEQIEEEPVLEQQKESSDLDVPDKEETSEGAITVYEFSTGEEDGTVVEEKQLESGTILEVVATDDVIIEQETQPQTFDLLDSFELASSMSTAPAPSIENGSWDDYPCSYGYTYDNSSAAQWGAWGGNGNLQGQKYEDTNNSDISNKVGVYTDGDEVKVYIKYALLWNGPGNGNDFNISVDGANSKFRVTLEDGTDLNGAYLPPGTYKLKVTNGDGSISGSEAEGSYGWIVIKENNAGNELEFSVPISSLQKQNSNVNTEHFSQVSFNSPNVMSSSVSCGGASSGTAGSTGIAMLMSSIGMLFSKKKQLFG